MKYLKYFESSIPTTPTQVGLELVNTLKKEEVNKGEWHHLPCYDFVYRFMNKYKKLNPAVLGVMKMPYVKDITSLTSAESVALGRRSLEIPLPADLAKMSGFKYINEKYNIGKLVDVNQAKIGDAINFWVYEFIEFSPAQKNYSFPKTTPVKFQNYMTEQKKKNPKFAINPNDWLIEDIKLIYGHYAVISEVDANYLYLSSSGEKGGANGIWNGVPKSGTDDMLTKVRKADILNFNNKSYNDMVFKKSDDISQGRTRLVLRASILNFI